MDELLAEQVRYYRERAPEYDATSRPDGDPFANVTALAAGDLRRLGPVEHAIELGAGTGQFTGVLAEIAGQVTALDTSPEFLALNAAKVQAGNVLRVVGDVFAWRPAEPVPLVVFGFLLSHIPRQRFAAFWQSVGEMLAPDGVAFVIDETPHGA